MTATIEKTPTGVAGLDDLTSGGVPTARTTVVTGGPGTGKTMLGVSFLVEGVRRYDEPGVLVTFEQTAEDLSATVASLGYDLPALQAQGSLRILAIDVDAAELAAAGRYDLDGLLARITAAVDEVGARRLVLDTVDVLSSGFDDVDLLRAALRRLLVQLRERGLTTLLTSEDPADRPDHGRLTQYLGDCAIHLELRLHQRSAVRTLRVVKYRGSEHVEDAVPFLIDRAGVWVMPGTASQLAATRASHERISSGLPALDEMLHERGYYRGSTVLVSGDAGTGKTSLAAYFVHASAGRGERCMFFSLEESQAQIVRNMRSIGLDLEPAIEQDLLRVDATRPSSYGIEQHLARMVNMVDEYEPAAVVIDPVTGFRSTAPDYHVQSMLTRLADVLKAREITAVLTSLGDPDTTDHEVSGISSLVDTWLHVRNVESHGERNRTLYLLKSRGMPHSNQIREFVITSDGVRLIPVYPSGGEILTGSARVAEQERRRHQQRARERTIERQREMLERRRRALESQVDRLQAEFEYERQAMEASIELEEVEEDLAERSVAAVLQSRTVQDRRVDDRVEFTPTGATADADDLDPDDGRPDDGREGGQDG